MFHHYLLLGILTTAQLFGSAPMALADDATDQAFYEPFDTLNRRDWYISDFTIKNPNFTTAWKADQVRLNGEGQVVLSLDPAPINTGKRFLGAEVQRRAYTHYGRYEAMVTPAEGFGVISAFFTYTGPHFGHPHDEIDIEFLGKDLNKVWLTRFADGERLPGQWMDLGFDAGDRPRLYAFEWSPERIVWTIDGEELMRVEGSERSLPEVPMRVYFSIWGGGDKQAEWSGTAPRETNAKVTFDCISYVPMGETGRQCSDDPVTN